MGSTLLTLARRDNPTVELHGYGLARYLGVLTPCMLSEDIGCIGSTVLYVAVDWPHCGRRHASDLSCAPCIVGEDFSICHYLCRQCTDSVQLLLYCTVLDCTLVKVEMGGLYTAGV